MTAAPRVGVVVLAHGAEPWLGACVDAVLDSTGVGVDLVVVDNDARAGDLAPVETLLAVDRRVRLLRPGTNTGFAGGCNLGAAALDAPFLALVNSDCLVGPGTLAALVAEADRPGTGPVMASVRMADDVAVVNSSGNPVHVLGTCWAGGLGAPEPRTEPFDVPAASGACLLLRRTVWDTLGGFDDAYFAYLEDTELSLRCRRRGLSVRCVPTAVAAHHYEFSRNPTKMYLLERNRLLLLATLWPARALAGLAPLLLALEVALLGLALAQGWGPAKLHGWVWLWRHRGHVRTRRAELAAERTAGEADWMRHLTPELADHVVGSAVAAAAVNAVVRPWWGLVLRSLGRRDAAGQSASSA